MMRPPVRSSLYVPGDRPELFAKAVGLDADALILDLEDAVAPAHKEQARCDVADWLSSTGGDPHAQQFWVRVNSGEAMAADIDAIVTSGLTGIVVPKCEDLDTLRTVDRLLDRVEQSNGIERSTVAVAPLIETAAGVLRAAELATGPRVRRLQIGEADLAADLELGSGHPEEAMYTARGLIVLASSAAGLDRPMGPVWTAIADIDGLEASTRSLFHFGFGGRSVIHPSHVGVVNRVFTPTDADVAAARRLVESFDQSVVDGTGATVDESGAMIDEAVVRSARQLLARVATSSDDVDQSTGTPRAAAGTSVS